MKVKIVKCTNHRAWYKDKIGEIFEVDNDWVNQTVQCSWQDLEVGDIVTIEGFKDIDKYYGGNEVKRLNVRESYEDDNVELIHYEDSSYTWIGINKSGYFKYSNVELRIGKNYNTSLTQANAILSIMGLQYELVEETDWSKVEVGSEVTWTKVQAPDGRLGSFHSYVPSLNKVIVICGNEIKAVDSSEVELC